MGKKIHGPLLLHAIDNSNLEKVVEILGKEIKTKAKVQEMCQSDVKRMTSEHMECPLLNACLLPDPAIVEYMVKNFDVNVNFVHKQNNGRRIRIRTPLQVAVRASMYATAEAILSMNGDANAQDHKGRTALHLAVRRADYRMAKVLLTRGAQANVADASGNTPLHVATIFGHVELVKVLIHYGADLYVKGQLGALPIHIAAKEGHISLIKLFCLHEMNANIMVPCYDEREKAPLHVAAEHGHFETATVLIELLGADVNIRDSEGETPLHCTVLHAYDRLGMKSKDDYAETAKVLIRQGAEVNARNGRGETALHLATRNEFHKVVDILLQARINPLIEDNGRNKAIDLVGANDTATRQMLKVAMMEREKAMNATLETSARSGGLSGSSGTLFSRTGTMGMQKAQSMESLDMAGPSYARNGSRMGTLNNQIGDRFAGNSVVSGYSLGQPTLKSAQSVPSLADDSSYMEPVEAIKQYQQQQQRRQQSNASPVDDEYATINDVKQRQLSKKQKAISLSTSALDDDMSEVRLVKTKSKKKSKKSKERLLSQDTEVTMNDAEESTVFDDAQSLDDLQVTAPKTKKKKKKGTTKKVKEPVVQDPTDSDQSMDFDSVSQIMEPPPPPQFARTKLRATMPVKLTSEDQKKVEKATADPKIQTWVQDQNAYAKKRSQTPPPSTLDDVGGKPSKTKVTTRQPPPPPAADNRLSMESEFSDMTSVTGTQSLSVVGGAKPSIVHIEVDDKQVPGRTIIRVIPVQNADGLDDDMSTVVSDATSTWDAGTVISDAETLRSLSSIPAKQRPPPPTKPKPAVMPRPTNIQPAPVQFQKIPPAASVQSQDNTSKAVTTPIFNKPTPPTSSKSVVQPSLSTPVPAVATAGKKPAVAIEKQVMAAKDESDSTDSSSGDEDEQVVSAKPAPAAASPLTKPKQPVLPKEPAPASPLTKPKQPALSKEPVPSTAAASTGQSAKVSSSQPASNEGRGMRQKHNSMGEVDITGYLDYSSTDVSPPKPAKVSFAGVGVGKQQQQQQQQHQGMVAPSPLPTLNRELSRSEDSLQSYTSWNREKQQAPILAEARNSPAYSSQRKPSTRSQEDLLQQQQAYQPQQLGQGQGQAVDPSRSSRMPPTRYALPGMARPPGPAAPGANAPISQGQFPRPQVAHSKETPI